MRPLATKQTAINQYNGFGSQLWDLAGARPSLDLQFAEKKSLVDATTGANLIDFTRASSGTYVDSQGVIKTAATNEPRFDHNPTTGESLGLLVEEQRTNLLLQSNGFDTNWTNANSSETSESGTAPDGTNTAWELKDTSDATAIAHSLNQLISFTSGTTYAFSVWMKAGTLTEGGIAIPSTAFGVVLVNRVNLTTGVVISTSTNSTTTVISYPDGWHRITLIATATATASGNIQIRVMNGGTSYIGTGTGTVLVWGAQLEAGAFPTSYIPTTTATVTRSADVASIPSIQPWFTSSLTDHTFYAESRSRGTLSNATLLEGYEGGNIKGLTVALPLKPRLLIRHGTSRLDTATFIPDVPLGSSTKIAITTSSTSSAACNGQIPALGVTPSQADWTSTSRLSIGSRLAGTSLPYTGTIQRICFWPTPLPVSTLQTITQ